jgi:hypothetical protein
VSPFQPASALMISVWMTLMRMVVWAGLERILRRMRRFFNSALARSPGARSPEWARLHAFLTGGEAAASELSGASVIANATVRDSYRGAGAVIRGVGVGSDVRAGQGFADAVLRGGAGVVAGPG